MKKLTHTFLLLLLFSACEQEVIKLEAPPGPDPDPCLTATAGSANFSKYVAIGSSYTAGFQAGALFTEGQNNSLGKILASRFSCAGGGTFNQPTINSEHGYD